jgi:hypothetical protein
MKQAIALILSCGMLQAADRGFDEIVHAISDQLHTRPLHIPFFGLVNFTVSVAHPAGVKHLNLAIFERADLDDRDLGKIIHSVRPEWQPFVHVHDRNETTLLFMTAEQKDCQLLVASFASGELTLVQLRLNPDAIRALMRRPDKPVHRPSSRTENQDDQ